MVHELEQILTQRVLAPSVADSHKLEQGADAGDWMADPSRYPQPVCRGPPRVGSSLDGERMQ